MRNDITPQEAREQLAEAEAATDRRAGDRRVHALATAGFGALIGAFMTVSRLVEDTSLETLVVVFYVMLLLGLAGWQTRAARTWPRRARRTSHLGLGGTVVLFLGGVIVFNVVDAQQEVVLLVLAGLLVAAPMLVAGVLIERASGRAGRAAVSAEGTMRPPHARHRLDDVIHAPVRFSIVATLASVDEAEFALVRDEVEVSDSVLSKQVSTLEQAGYVKVRKGYVGKRPRTWLSLTRTGRSAYTGHLAALREIAGA